MPSLNWAAKSLPQPPDTALEIDSIVYPQGVGYPDATPENQLILGDNLRVMSALLPEFGAKINLIYADPPFFTNRHYPMRIGRGEDSRRPQDWQLAEGYPDHWADMDTYLDMLYPRLRMMYDLLAPTGTLYLHLDWHASAYARLLLDEIFGSERLLNEIVWIYHGPSPIRSAFNRKHDTILVYTKSDKYTFNVDAVRQPYDPSTVKTFTSSRKAGFGKIPDLARGKVPEDWWYFPVVARLHSERSGYPTQKPERLLERIIRASSNPGDLVADFFCGSGTTGVVAAKLGRHFITTDSSFRAIHTSRLRLVQSGCSSFVMQQLSGRASPQEHSHFAGSLHLKITHQSVHLEAEQPDEIDFWELDPAWDGKLFRSAAQAIRPRLKGSLVDHLDLPGDYSGLPVCVRFVDIHGNTCSLVISPSAT
jgi:site-specific DNA-methyltransferase (adenine-specific)